jgi:hypothetical protein
MATDLFRGSRNYEWLTPAEIESRINVPARYGNLEYWVTGHGHLAFTWARPHSRACFQSLLIGSAPPDHLWMEAGPALWIADMVASPDFPGVKVGRQLSWVLAEQKIARKGEAVYYRRNGGAHPGRLGTAIVRG